jgi:toxin ParE2
MKYHFSPHAKRELEDATVYYDTISEALGDSFIDEFQRALSLIRRLPQAFTEFSVSTRQCQLKRFPYLIVYRLQESEIEIVTVMHMAREPKYWTERG